MGSQQFCLKWNNHQSNLLVVFDQLLQNEAFVDVTLACEGLSLKAHKMVLSACSPYFQSLFLENPCKHPIVILNSMRYCDLKAIIDFMYKGEVNVSQEQLSALLKTAEMLKVKGLAEVTNQTTQTLMTQSVVVPPLDSRASPTLPEQVGQPPPSSTSQRSSVSPPPKRKKLRSSAVSSSASSPQTPSMSTASLSSQKAELHNANLDTKIVPPMVLPLVTDLSQDGHSNHDHQADQNLEQNQDHLMDAPPEISEDHSSTSNLTEKGFEKSGGDQTSQDPHSHMLDLAFQNLPSTPSTSGIQTATDEVLPIKCEQLGIYLPEEDILKIKEQTNNIWQFATSLSKFLFSREERLACNAYPAGKRKGLDSNRIEFLRQIVLNVYNVPPELQNNAWNKCITSINAHCRYLRWKERYDGNILSIEANPECNLSNV